MLGRLSDDLPGFVTPAVGVGVEPVTHAAGQYELWLAPVERRAEYLLASASDYLGVAFKLFLNAKHVTILAPW